MTYQLIAQREGEERFVMPLCGREGLETPALLEQAREIIEELEEHGAWPEGFDAIVLKEDSGRGWCLRDEWEELES